jgi:hypothetical protein
MLFRPIAALSFTVLLTNPVFAEYWGASFWSDCGYDGSMADYGDNGDDSGCINLGQRNNIEHGARSFSLSSEQNTVKLEVFGDSNSESANAQNYYHSTSCDRPPANVAQSGITSFRISRK